MANFDKALNKAEPKQKKLEKQYEDNDGMNEKDPEIKLEEVKENLDPSVYFQMRQEDTEMMKERKRDYLMTGVPDEYRSQLEDMFLKDNSILLTELASLPFYSEISNPFEFFKSLSKEYGRKLEATGVVNKIRLFFTEIKHFNDSIDGGPKRNTMDMVEFYNWFYKKNQRKMKVAYPASGSDQNGYLDCLDDCKVEQVDTFGIDKGIDSTGNDKIKESKIKNNYFNGNFVDVVKNDSEVSNYDLLVLDMHSFGVLREKKALFDQAVMDQLMGADGYVLVPKFSFGRGGGGNMEFCIEGMNHMGYEQVVDLGNNLVFQKAETKQND